MITRKLLFLVTAGIAFATAQAQMTYEQFLIEEKNTSAGLLSPENQAFIQSIMDQMNFSHKIHTRQPLMTLIEVLPALQFEQYFPGSNIWYINETWFNGLSEQEKTFIIGRDLQHIQGLIETTNSAQNIALVAGSIMIGLTAIGCLYKGINSYPTILGFQNSKMKSFGLAYAIVAVANLGIINPLVAKYIAYHTHAKVLKADAEIAQKFNCVQGAIELLTSLQENIKPLYEKDVAYWKGAYEGLPSRIEALKALQV